MENRKYKPLSQSKPDPGRCLTPEEMGPYLDVGDGSPEAARQRGGQNIPNSVTGLPDDLAEQSRALLQHQREHWPLLAQGLESLETVRTRTFDFVGYVINAQFNPGRMASSLARVDKKSILERKCFLCQQNLPPEQKGICCGDYMILCNPFPVFSEHFTIAHLEHIPQLIRGRFESMLEFAAAMGRYYTLIYNGPRCGASAPDHLHFQGVERGSMPMDAGWDDMVARYGTWVIDNDSLRMARVDDGLRRYIILESDDKDALKQHFDRLYDAFSKVSNQAGSGSGPGEEPMINILMAYEGCHWRLIVFLRRKHRPARYFAEGDGKLVFSPASIDFGGVCITPIERDFQRITADDLRSMFSELSVTPEVLNAVADNI